MPASKTHFDALKAYIPEGSFEPLMHMIHEHKVQLLLTRERKTMLGTYRAPFDGKGHRISVNANLNQYAFLITLLHEIAHLTTFKKHAHRVSPHGKEWKSEFSSILIEFLKLKIFPADVENTLKRSIKNPAASSCSDEQLFLALKRYDKSRSGKVLVDEIKPGDHFTLEDGRVFLRGEKLRKRIKCTEVSSGKKYLFSILYEVLPVALS